MLHHEHAQDSVDPHHRGKVDSPGVCQSPHATRRGTDWESGAESSRLGTEMVKISKTDWQTETSTCYTVARCRCLTNRPLVRHVLRRMLVADMGVHVRTCTSGRCGRLTSPEEGQVVVANVRRAPDAPVVPVVEDGLYIGQVTSLGQSLLCRHQVLELGLRARLVVTDGRQRSAQQVQQHKTVLQRSRQISGSCRTAYRPALP